MSAQIIKAPYRPSILHKHSIFLAGGITDAPRWQDKVSERLIELPVTILNPRRDQFDNPSFQLEREQVRWEREMINTADLVLFYFCAAALCPVTMFELGTVVEQEKAIAVAIEPGYFREDNLRIQLQLLRPGMPVLRSLDALVGRARHLLNISGISYK